MLVRQREQVVSGDQVNLDLTYSVSWPPSCLSVVADWDERSLLIASVLSQSALGIFRRVHPFPPPSTHLPPSALTPSPSNWPTTSQGAACCKKAPQCHRNYNSTVMEGRKGHDCCVKLNIQLRVAMFVILWRHLVCEKKCAAPQMKHLWCRVARCCLTWPTSTPWMRCTLRPSTPTKSSSKTGCLAMQVPRTGQRMTVQCSTVWRDFCFISFLFTCRLLF